MNGLYLGIGGNSGKRTQFLTKAKRLIKEHIGIIEKESSIYQTAAWGNTNQQDFYNQVLLVRTILNPKQSLKKCLDIEEILGRKRIEKWATRTIDIDILFFNNEIIKSKDLIIPHPFIQERNFVLVPLEEIAPHYIHPILRKKIFTLNRLSKDRLLVKKVSQGKLLE